MKVLSATFDMQSKRINNVTDPSAAQDAATKNYADGLFLPPVNLTINDATTGAPQALQLGHNTSGTPAVNMGVNFAFYCESSTTIDRQTGQIDVRWSDVADATRTAYLRFQLVQNAVIATKMQLHGSGGLSLNRGSAPTDPGAGNLDVGAGYMIAGAALAPDHLACTATNDAAAAGELAERVAASKALASKVAMSANANTNINSISLTAGDWDVRGIVCFEVSVVTTAAALLSANIGTTSAGLADDGFQGYQVLTQSTGSTQTIYGSVALAPRRISLSAPTTVYIVGKTSLAGSGFGYIEARRAR